MFEFSYLCLYTDEVAKFNAKRDARYAAERPARSGGRRISSVCAASMRPAPRAGRPHARSAAERPARSAGCHTSLRSNAKRLDKMSASLTSIIDYEYTKYTLNSAPRAERLSSPALSCFASRNAERAARSGGVRARTAAAPRPPCDRVASHAAASRREKGGAERRLRDEPRRFDAPRPLQCAASGKLKICVSGRIKGVDKAKKLVVQSGVAQRASGRLKPQSLDAIGLRPQLCYASKGIYTKWGVLGIKIYARHGAYA